MPLETYLYRVKAKSKEEAKKKIWSFQKDDSEVRFLGVLPYWTFEPIVCNIAAKEKINLEDEIEKLKYGTIPCIPIPMKDKYDPESYIVFTIYPN